MKRQPALVLRQPAVLDIGAALLMVALSLVFWWKFLTPGGGNPKLIHSFGSLASWHWHLLLWWLASAVALGVLPLRRRFPVAVFAVTLAATVVHSEVLAFPLSPADLAVVFAAYTLAAARPRRISLPVLAGGVVLAVAAGWAGLDGSWASRFFGGGWLDNPSGAILGGTILAAAWLAGDGTRTRR